jgi:hypothetical protein
MNMDLSKNQSTQHVGKRTFLTFIAGIAIWFLHQNIIYALSSVSCKWSWFSFTIAGIPGIQVVETVISLVALVLMAYVIHIDYQDWSKYQREKPSENPEMLEDTEKGRRPLAAFIALTLNCFFFLFIIGTFVVIFSLNSCVQG